MSTRSYIGVKENNVFTMVYCHFDGGIQRGVGEMLHKHYQGVEKAREIVALGSLASLGSKIKPDEGTKHTYFDPQDDVTVAYHRDRGDDFDAPQTTKDVKKLPPVDYLYYFDVEKNAWYVKTGMRAVKLANKIG